MATPGSTTAPKDANDYQSTRDNYIPVFDGTPANYREWRKRITIYEKKMELSNRKNEGVLNLLGSLQGTAWKLVEGFDLDRAAHPTAFGDILAMLDTAFKYDSKVEMPSDFSAYFESLSRRNGQSLLQFVTDHDDRLRRLEKHGVRLPAEVRGWHFLTKSNISREQRQLVMTQANSLDRTKIQQALYSILGQDYKHSHAPASNANRWAVRPSGKGRAYYKDGANDEWGYCMNEDDDTAYFEADGSWEEDGYDEFDADAAYYMKLVRTRLMTMDLTPRSTMSAMPPTWIRKRFNALQWPSHEPWLSSSGRSWPQLRQCTFFSQLPSPPKGKGKGKKGRGNGRGGGKNNYKYTKPPTKAADPKGRANAALGAPRCLRCGSTSHRTAQCNQGSKPSPKPAASSPNKRQATEGIANANMMDPETGMVLFEDQQGVQRPDCAMMDPCRSFKLSQSFSWVMAPSVDTSTTWRSWTFRSTRSSSRWQIALSFRWRSPSLEFLDCAPACLYQSTTSLAWFRPSCWKARLRCSLVDHLPRPWVCPWTSWMIASSSMMVTGNLQFLAGTVNTSSHWRKTLILRSFPKVLPLIWSSKMRTVPRLTSSTSRPRKTCSLPTRTLLPKDLWPWTLKTLNNSCARSSQCRGGLHKPDAPWDELRHQQTSQAVGSLLRPKPRLWCGDFTGHGHSVLWISHRLEFLIPVSSESFLGLAWWGDARWSAPGSHLCTLESDAKHQRNQQVEAPTDWTASGMASPGPPSVLQTCVPQATLWRATCPHRAAGTCLELEDKGLQESPRLQGQFPSMSIRLRLQRHWSGVETREESNHIAHEQDGSSPGDESTLPWRPPALQARRPPSWLQNHEDFLRGGLPACHGLNPGCRFGDTRISTPLGLWICSPGDSRVCWQNGRTPCGGQRRGSSSSPEAAQKSWSSFDQILGWTSAEPRSQWHSGPSSWVIRVRSLPALQASKSTSTCGAFRCSELQPEGPIWHLLDQRPEHQISDPVNNRRGHQVPDCCLDPPRTDPRSHPWTWEIVDFVVRTTFRTDHWWRPSVGLWWHDGMDWWSEHKSLCGTWRSPRPTLACGETPCCPSQKRWGHDDWGNSDGLDLHPTSAEWSAHSCWI